MLPLVHNNIEIVVGGFLFDLLTYADNSHCLSRKIEEFQASANTIDNATSSFGIKINASKPKALKPVPPPSPKSQFRVLKSSESTSLLT